MSKTILIVDDDPMIHADLRGVLKDSQYSFLSAYDGKEAIDTISQNTLDLMLLDLNLPRISGMDVLRHSASHHPSLPVVIISGQGGIPEAVEATKLGAYGFIEKPVDVGATRDIVQDILSKTQQQLVCKQQLHEIYNRYGMVGNSPEMNRIYQLIDKAANTGSKVLLIGEQGTGKEIVARAIHSISDRSGPFIPVNCAAMPETLIESELFGHEKGSFTNAIQAREGMFELAKGGTLFLDEIGDMSLTAQAKTLRTLEDNKIMRIGGKREIDVDTRIVAATNKNLKNAMESGTFRKDLYYRLNVLTIEIPPLKDHRDDIPALLHHYIEIQCNKMEVPIKRVEPNALAILIKYNWPGNIRELRNIIERLVAFTDEDIIAAQHVIEALNLPDPSSTDLNLYQAREAFEENHIRSALNAFGWRIQKTADALGINRTYLWAQIKRYGIDRSEQSVNPSFR